MAAVVGVDVGVGPDGGWDWGAAATESFFAPGEASWVAAAEALVSSCFMSWSQTPELCKERASRAELCPRQRAWPLLQ